MMILLWAETFACPKKCKSFCQNLLEQISREKLLQI